jgi:hypothetical protein
MLEPLIIAQEFGLPHFVVFDADGGESNSEKRAKHERDNKALISALGASKVEPFPKEIVWGETFVQWPEDLGASLRDAVGTDFWDKSRGAASKGIGNPKGSNEKNMEFIAERLLYLHEQKKFPEPLKTLCERIVAFAAGPT